MYFLLLVSLKWLRNQGNCRPTPEIVWKTFFTFDFHILHLTSVNSTSVLELFPVVVFQFKNDFQWAPTHLPATETVSGLR